MNPGNQRPSRLGTILIALAMVGSAFARLPVDAPALPPPDNLTVIQVDTAQALADACWNLQSNQAIVIAPGTYDLASVAFPNGVDGRLTVGRFGAQPISNIQIRGATGDPSDVVLHGSGMLDPIVPHGIQLFTATNVTIADLSIRDVYYHAVMVSGSTGARDVRLYNIRAFDIGQQIIKGSGAGADDVVIEYSELFYTNGAVEHPEGSPPGSCYTNAIDATGGDNWVIRDNLIRGINCRNNALAGPSILLWQGSSGSVVERNTIIDSSRGVSLGLGGNDHTGGIVRNNFIRWNPAASYVVDVGIYTVSPDSNILHNTVLTRGRYPNAIEIRFSGATHVAVGNNLLDAAVTARNGASPIQSNNLETADPTWFVDEANGDLHLTMDAVGALDQVDRLPEAPTDFDGVLRPTEAGGVDLGAAEFDPDPAIFLDGYEG